MKHYNPIKDTFKSRMIVSFLAISILSIFNIFIFFDKNNPQATRTSLAEGYQWHQDYSVCPLYSALDCSNFKHIKVFGLLYGGHLGSSYSQYQTDTLNILDATHAYENLHDWFAHHYDLTSADTQWGGVSKNVITAYNPNISAWQYMTLGGLGYMLDLAAGGINILSQKYLNAEIWAQNHGDNFENYFIHHDQNKTISGCSFASSCGAAYEALLENVVYYNGSSYADWTSQAFGYSWGSDQIRKNYTLTFGQTNSILYFGNLEKFDHLYINLSQNASADWRGAWEYWNGSTWVTLNLLQDTTNELTQSGFIRFFPPANWGETLLADGNPYTFNSLAYIRLRTLNQDTTQPIAHTYQLASGGALQNVPDIGNESPGVSAFHTEIYLPRTYQDWDFNPNDQSRDRGTVINFSAITFPGWDDKNDVNNDGYIDDDEYASLSNTSATARFKYQSRISSFFYQYMSYGGNYGNNNYRNFIVGNIANNAYDAVNFSGIMFDSLSTRVPTRYWYSDVSFLEYSSATSTQFINDVRQTIIDIQNSLPGVIITNNDNLNLTFADIVDGSEGEILFHIKETNTNSRVGQLPTSLINKFNRIVDNANQNKLLTLMNVATGDDNINTDREKIFGLAAYYLLDDDSTYFWYQNPYKYSEPWNYWFDAITYDIGAASGGFNYQWATGVDTDNNQYYIFSRNRANGNKVLVKFKPKSTSAISDSTITTHQLDKSYYLLQADGTLSANTVTSVSLRNNEGAILIDPATLTVAPTCSDNIQNGSETGIDCGGSCSACSSHGGGGGQTPPPTETPPIVCGNNIQESGEQCDDGNIINNDGCSYLCQIEIDNTPTTTPNILDISKLQGTLVKTNNDPKVYYINENNQRYFIPNLNTFKSWFKNFNNLTVITPQTLASFEYIGRLTVKPGNLVQFKDSNKVYAVEPIKTLRWIKSSTVFKDFGYDFKKIISLPEEDFQYYTQGEDLNNSTIHPTGQLLKHGNFSPIFYIKDNIEYWIKDETTFLSLGFRWQDIITIPIRYWYTRILDNFSFRLKDR